MTAEIKTKAGLRKAFRRLLICERNVPGGSNVFGACELVGWRCAWAPIEKGGAEGDDLIRQELADFFHGGVAARHQVVGVIPLLAVVGEFVLIGEFDFF